MTLDPQRESETYARMFLLALCFKPRLNSLTLNAVIFIRIMHAFAGFYL